MKNEVLNVWSWSVTWNIAITKASRGAENASGINKRYTAVTDSHANELLLVFIDKIVARSLLAGEEDYLD